MKLIEEAIRDEPSLKGNIYRHLELMSSIIGNPNLNEDRYNWAIEHLLALLRPYGDTEFDKNFNEIKSHFDGPVGNDDLSKILDTRKGGVIEASNSTQDATELIKEQNRLILREIHGLINRLDLGLPFFSTETIGTNKKAKA